jgi:hypothetical protein
MSNMVRKRRDGKSGPLMLGAALRARLIVWCKAFAVRLVFNGLDRHEPPENGHDLCLHRAAAYPKYPFLTVSCVAAFLGGGVLVPRVRYTTPSLTGATRHNTQIDNRPVGNYLPDFQ